MTPPSLINITYRYRLIPTFGRGTIRRFGRNASALKKMAARDYEDLLQCAIPVFEGLFPPTQDTIVRRLLFELGTWHAFAKLRLHTETTVDDLESSTTRLGESLRVFEKDICRKYKTYDLPSEEAARTRRKSATTLGSQKQKEKMGSTQSTHTRRQRLFRLETVKLHSLGGYAKAIRLHGTTDSYNTQTACLTTLSSMW
ncbi:hypothetical protein BGW80DRAFT_1181194 [Lactifluus volemus]|nr:hypothetical protein BGW80DRAFT_1181194 [Lactifluus volemus]